MFISFQFNLFYILDFLQPFIRKRKYNPATVSLFNTFFKNFKKKHFFSHMYLNISSVENHPLLRVVFIHRCLLFTSNNPLAFLQRTTVNSSWRDTIENFLLRQPELLLNLPARDGEQEKEERNDISRFDGRSQCEQQMLAILQTKRVLQPVFPVQSSTETIQQVKSDAYDDFDRHLLLSNSPALYFAKVPVFDSFVQVHKLAQHSTIQATIIECITILKAVRRICEGALLLPLRILFTACPFLHERTSSSISLAVAKSRAEQNEKQEILTGEKLILLLVNGSKKLFDVFFPDDVFSHQQRAIPLLFGCLSGDVEFVKELLSASFQVNTSALRHNQLLNVEDSVFHNLVFEGHVDMMRFLLNELHQEPFSHPKLQLRSFSFPSKTLSKSPLDLAISCKIKEHRVPLLKLLLSDGKMPILVSQVGIFGAP